MSDNEDDFDHDFDDDDGDILTCDVCGLEEGEETADETWIAFMKPGVFEVLVCVKCAESDDKLRQAFGIFLKDLGTKKREAMS
jgi:hypothetical protein